MHATESAVSKSALIDRLKSIMLNVGSFLLPKKNEDIATARTVPSIYTFGIALWNLFPSAAMADGVVVASTAPGIPLARIVKDGERLSLPQGSQVTVLSVKGQTVTLRAPGGMVQDTGGDGTPGLLEKLAGLLNPPESGTVGATRGRGDPICEVSGNPGQLSEIVRLADERCDTQARQLMREFLQEKSPDRPTLPDWSHLDGVDASRRICVPVVTLPRLAERIGGPLPWTRKAARAISPTWARAPPGSARHEVRHGEVRPDVRPQGHAPKQLWR